MTVVAMKNSTMMVRVARRNIEADGIVSFEFASLDGRDLPAFDAGSHIDVHLPTGHVRQYSLCSAPHERSRYQIAVLREEQSRGGSAGMHDAVNEGDELSVSLPRNHFALASVPAKHLLLAGGIGLTPLLCMAQHLDRTGKDFELHYCARSRSRAAFLERLADASWAERVHYHFDDEDEHPGLHEDEATIGGGFAEKPVSAVVSRVGGGAHQRLGGEPGAGVVIDGFAVRRGRRAER